MPGLQALDVVAAAHEHSPKTKILILSAFGDRTRVRLLRDAGIDGYLLKDEAPELLLSAVHTILGGDSWFSRAILDTFMTRSQHPDSPEHQCATLMGREQSLLRLIGKGRSFRQNARQLEITEQSVRNYCPVLYSKLGVKSRSQAIVWIRTHASDL